MNPKHRLTVAVWNALRDPDGVVFNHGFGGIDDLFKAIWKNTSVSGGMALTSLGCEYFINLLELEYWSFAVETNTSATILMMERYMTTPYHLTMGKSKNHRNLILFDESVATQLILYGNDLKSFLLAQDSASDRPISKQ
jgi:hypothetical protein